MNNLHTAWTTFTTSLTNSDFIKDIVDLLTLLLNTVNKLTDAFGSLSPWLKGGMVIGAGKAILDGSKFLVDKKLRNFLTGQLGQDGEMASGSLGDILFRALTNEETPKLKLSDAYAAFKDAFTAIDTEADLEKWIQAEERVRQAAQELDEILDFSYLLTPDRAEAAIAGAEEGLARAVAEQEAVEGFNAKTLPKRMAAAFAEGKAQGGSIGAGINSSLGEIKKTKVFTKLGEIWGSKLGTGIKIGLVVFLSYELAKLVANAFDPVLKSQREIAKLQEKIDENQNKITDYSNEISELKAQEKLTAAEKVRLEWLEKQTKELEKQNEIRFQEQYESWAKSREGGVKESGYLDELGVWQMLSPTEYADKLIKNYQEYEEAQANLDTNDPNSGRYYQDYENWKTANKEDLEKEFEEYSQYSQFLSDEELANYYKIGNFLGKDFSLFASVDEDTYNKIAELAEAGNLTSEVFQKLIDENPKLQAYFDITGDTITDVIQQLNNLSDASETSIKVKGYKDAADELKNIKKSVSAITDAVSGLYKDGYVDIEKLSTIVSDDAFNSLPSFENFFDILGKAGKEDIPQVVDAMEQLLAEYMASDTVLSSLNESTAGLYKNMLVNMGVTNAQEVIDAKLNQIRAKEVVTTIDANNALGALGRTTHDIKIHLGELAEQYGVTEDALTAYITKNRVANKNYLSTKASRQELRLLVESLGFSAEAMRKFNSAMNVVDNYDADIANFKLKAQNATTEELRDYYNANVEFLRDEKDKYLGLIQDMVSTEIDAINLVPTIVDPTQFDDTSKSTEKEIQKLSELYNAKKKVAEIEEKISDLEEARNVLQSYDAQRANENTQIEALQKQYDLTKDLIAQNEILRKQKLASASAEWSDLYTYNELNHQLALTPEYYNAINKNGKATKQWSAEVLNNFKKWVEEYDDILDFSTEQENVLDQINTKLQEFWKGYRDNYIDLVNELADLFERQAQNEIDSQKEKYDKMKDLDDKYLDELRKNIEARRDARNRENDVEDIAKKQKRLNMLMRDTSGRNASEIADLQKEIADAQQDLIDDDVDRVLDSLEDANDQQQENWDNAIEKLEDQLDQDKENGKFIRLAEETLQKTPEEIKAVFKDLYEELDVYSQAELNSKLDEVVDKLVGAIKYRDDEDPRDATGSTTGTGANGKYTRINYLDAQGNLRTGYVSEDNKTYKDRDLTKRIDEGSIVANGNQPGKGWKLIGDKGVSVDLTPEQMKLLGVTTNNTSSSTTSSNTAATSSTSTKTATINGTGGKGLNLRADKSTSSAIKGAYTDGTKVEVLDDTDKTWWKVKCKGQTGWMSAKYLKYARGGLVDYTGPAWVDGNPSQPEAFLSAKDTKNFTELKELLALYLRESGNSRSFSTGGAQSAGDCNIYITVDQIASDYDIDEAVARVKQEIMSGSNYRNVNLINRRR